MRCRTLLATAGALLSAGCGGVQNGGRGDDGPGPHVQGFINDSDEPDFKFGNMSSERNFSAGSAEDVNFEFDESSFEADFDSGFDESGPTPTPIETDPRATELMTRAMDGIRKTYTTYVGYAGADANLLDVNAATESFHGPKLRTMAQNARQPLEEATEYAPEGQKDLILSLVQVTVFLEDLARVRAALIDGYDDVVFATERLYAESTLRAKQTADRINEFRSEAQSLSRPLRNEIDAEAVSVFEPIGGVYREKMRQIRSEVRALRNVQSAVTSGVRGIDGFKDGVPAFYDQNYEQARRALSTAKFGFNAARTSFGFVDESTGMQEKTSEAAAVMGALDSAADALHKASEAKVENETQKRFLEGRRAAERAVESNDIASDMRTAKQIIT